VIFVDTSDILGLADASDRWHAAARQAYEERVRNGETLVVTSLIWAETIALVERRLSRDVAILVARALERGYRTEWVDARRHALALESWRSGRVSGTRFVDCSSFVVMREVGIDRFLGLDRHFLAAGFHSVCGNS